MTPQRATPPRLASPPGAFDPAGVAAFVYDSFELDLAVGTLTCHYRLDDMAFVERLRFAPAIGAHPAAAERAARLVFLLAGISYYKAAAPPRIEFGPHSLTEAEAAMLKAFYIDGLGEYAYRNQLDLRDLTFSYLSAEPAPVTIAARAHQPLVPFGGGIDSIVTLEAVRERHTETALFVLSRMGDRFAALEAAASVTGLPVLRAERELDEKVLRSAALGLRNGHVPVTAILSAIAVLVAVLNGRSAVIMSNEWSASSGNLMLDGRSINHQYSKSAAFETLFCKALADSFNGGPEYFSLLRPFCELAIARRFAELTKYHATFRSCNRAFSLDASQRLGNWCGVCDKCCFIDLILAPFLSASALARIFDGREPLDNPDTTATFRTLLDLGPGPKPFECVGERTECRAAAQLAYERADRRSNTTLAQLVAELGANLLSPAEISGLLRPIGVHHIPESYAPHRLLG